MILFPYRPKIVSAFASRVGQQERGVTLWLVILILGLALAASMGASALVLGEIRQTRIITDSVTAFFAADAGVEQALYQLCKQNDKADRNNQPVGSAQYSYAVDRGGGALSVVSTGSFRNSRRAVELTGFTENAGSVDCGQAGVGGGGPSLLAQWKMDETSENSCGGGNDVCDAIANNHGDALGGVSIVIGGGLNGSNARSFDGINDRISITSPTGLPTHNANQTIIAWFKYSSPQTSGAYLVALKGSQLDVGFGSGAGYILADKSGGEIVARNSTFVPSSNAWHQYAYTYDGTIHRLYIDGVEQATSTTAPDAGSPTSITIGNRITADLPFKGTIDEVSIYNLPLSATQICDLYKSISGASSCGPEAIKPSRVTDLTASGATQNSINLNWTAPGDDGNIGTAASYDVRYSTSAITDANWGSATQATGEPIPLPVGSPQSMTITGLASGITYYFAIKTSDEIPNISDLSNVPNRATVNVNLIAQWKMDETSGTNVADSIDGSPGTAMNGASIVTGFSDNARSFDGTNDYVDMGAAKTWGASNNLTVSAWVYPTALSAKVIWAIGNPGDYTSLGHLALTENGGSASVKELQFLFYSNPGGTVYRRVYSSNDAIPLNTWSYVTGVVRNNEMYVYVNGLDVSSSRDGGGVSLSDVSRKMFLGKRAAADDDWFVGKIDEVTFHNTALTATQICDLYESVGGTSACSADNDGDGSLASVDCDDNNPNVFPGQTNFFTTPRSGGSFDYNCDGSVTQEEASVRVCEYQTHGCGFFPWFNGRGWESGGVAACGTTATFRIGNTCENFCGGDQFSYVTSKTQACR